MERVERDEATLPAGRELDALVAEAFFEWRVERGEDEAERWLNARHPDANGGRVIEWRWFKNVWGTESVIGCEWELPHYSTRIEAAWRVVEKLVPDRYAFWQLDSLGFDGEEWRCVFAADVAPDNRHFSGADADTAPLAICRAALRAVEAR